MFCLVRCETNGTRPSIKNLTKRSMVHVRLKVGYKQDFSLEVDELDEELIFDVCWFLVS